MKYPYFRFTKWMSKPDLAFCYSWINHFAAEGIACAIIKRKADPQYAVWRMGQAVYTQERYANNEAIPKGAKVIHERGNFNGQVAQ